MPTGKPLIVHRKLLGKLPSRSFPFETGDTLKINNPFRIETFTKCHDAADPMGLVFRNNGIKIGLVTDMGRSTRLAEDRLKACNVLILEFNYDPTMLSEGPYPLDLKRRDPWFRGASVKPAGRRTFGNPFP